MQETAGLGDTVAWVHGKHNVRFGGDFRRVYYDMIGNTNSTGTYVFTGLFTQQPGSSGTSGTGNTGVSGLARSGSSLADLLLGLPQETTLQAAYQESHLRQNEIDGYAQDDWRAMKNLTFLIGLRYDYYSPYSEEHDRLATLDVSGDFTQRDDRHAQRRWSLSQASIRAISSTRRRTISPRASALPLILSPTRPFAAVMPSTTPSAST